MPTETWGEMVGSIFAWSSYRSSTLSFLNSLITLIPASHYSSFTGFSYSQV